MFHDEPLELKLQYLTEIKALATSITILLADWNAFKSRLIANAPSMLKMIASDGPATIPHSWLHNCKIGVSSFLELQILLFETKITLRVGEMLEEEYSTLDYVR